MSIAHAEPAVLPSEGHRRRWPVSAGWLPALLIAGVVAAALVANGVSARDLAAFSCYLVLGIVLPGTLLWRTLTGRATSLPADIAAGTALGYAMETLTYIVARWLDLPLLVLAWPVVAIAAFLARRRRTGGSAVARVPLWWAWAIAAIIAYLMLLSVVTFFSRHGLTWPGYAAPYVDMPYHLSLIGEIKHHMPPTLPTVLGEGLRYHWFVYAEMAATSWVTGIEPQTLLYRLSVLPMTAATVVVVATTARRVTGRWWAGPAAIALAYFAASPALNQTMAKRFSTGSMPTTLWISPTQTFGNLIFAAVALLLVDLLRGKGTGRGRWVALALLMLVLAGAKATFLPLTVAGLLLVLAVSALRDRRLHRPTLGALAITSACLLLAQFVIFGGGGQGMVVAPLSAMRQAWGQMYLVAGLQLATVPLAPVVGLSLIHLLCLGCIWAGLFGLLRRSTLYDLPVLFMIGMGVAAIGAVVTLGHPGLAQMYFLHSSRPYLSIAAVCGMIAVRSWRWAWCGTAAGVVLAFAASLAVGPRLRIRTPDFLPFALPYILCCLLFVVAALVLYLLRKPVALPLIALAVGLIVPTSYKAVTAPLMNPPSAARRTIPAGALTAGRWLRDHSSPDDVVATNAHCRRRKSDVCDSRSFWVSAYTERRVLVEGWAYAETTLARTRLFAVSHVGLPFWDQRLLADNDEAFLSPTSANIDRMRAMYGVKWLFVDNKRNPSFPDLVHHAKLRFRNGGCSVYELEA